MLLVLYRFLQRVRSAFSGSDPDHVFDRVDTNLAVTHLAGVYGVPDGVDDLKEDRA